MYQKYNKSPLNPNSFGGFPLIVSMEENWHPEDEIPLSKLMAIQKLVELKHFTDYVHVDDNAITVQTLINQEITVEFHSNATKNKRMKRKNNWSKVKRLKSLQTPQKFFQQVDALYLNFCAYFCVFVLYFRIFLFTFG